MQRLLGLWFMASVIVLSYIATIEIVKNHADPRRDSQELAQVERPLAPQPILGGPVYIPRREKRTRVQVKYRKPIHKKKASTQNWIHIGYKPVKRLHTKKVKRSPASSNEILR